MFHNITNCICCLVPLLAYLGNLLMQSQNIIKPNVFQVFSTSGHRKSSSFGCDNCGEYNEKFLVGYHLLHISGLENSAVSWSCTLHGTHRIPEHCFEMVIMIMILFIFSKQCQGSGWGKLYFHFLHFDLSCRQIQFN